MAEVVDLESLAEVTKLKLLEERADLALLAQWNGGRRVPSMVSPERLSLKQTNALHAHYLRSGFKHHWPPRALCGACGEPSCWSDKNGIVVHPWEVGADEGAPHQDEESEAA